MHVQCPMAAVAHAGLPQLTRLRTSAQRALLPYCMCSQTSGPDAGIAHTAHERHNSQNGTASSVQGSSRPTALVETIVTRTEGMITAARISESVKAWAKIGLIRSYIGYMATILNATSTAVSLTRVGTFSATYCP